MAVEGWSKLTGHDVVDLAKKFEEYGVEAIIYTDIGRDGMMTGQHRRHLQARAAAEDADHRLGRTEQPAGRAGGAEAGPEGIIGVIAGRALYEGKIDLKKAQAAANKALGKE